MASTLSGLTLYVTHVNTEQTSPLVGITFFARADQEGYKEFERVLRELDPLLMGSSPPPIQTLAPAQLCLVYINNQWNRAEIVSLDKVSLTGYVMVNLIDFGATQMVPVGCIRTLDVFPMNQMSAIQQYAAFVEKFILLDIFPPHGQWTPENIMFFKHSMEGHQFRAATANFFNGALGVRLFTLSGELLSQRFVESGMALMGIPYRGPAVTIQQQPPPPRPFYPAVQSTAAENFRAPQFPVLTSSVPPPATAAVPATVTEPSPPPLARRPNAYMASELEANQVHDVYVMQVESSLKLIVQPIKNEPALDVLRDKLTSVNLVPLKDPAKGKPCLAIFSEDELLYRAMITNVSASGDSCSLYYVDYGNTETRKLNCVFEIPDSLITMRLLAIRVSLAFLPDQQPQNTPAVIETLKNLTLNKRFTCTVVGDHRPQQVELIDEEGRNIVQVLMEMLNGSPKKPTAQPKSPVKPQQKTVASPVEEPSVGHPLLVRIPRPPTQRIESITITYAQKVGFMFGQLESRSLEELEAVQQELAATYEKLPQKPLIYADVCPHLDDHAVIRWAEDALFYRVQIVEEFARDVDVLFVDYGNVVRVARREIYSPVSSLKLFSRPAFGINCRLVSTAEMTDDAWAELIMDASIEVTILKETNGTYDVELSRNTKNQPIRDAITPTQHQEPRTLANTRQETRAPAPSYQAAPAGLQRESRAQPPPKLAEASSSDDWGDNSNFGSSPRKSNGREFGRGREERPSNNGSWRTFGDAAGTIDQNERPDRRNARKADWFQHDKRGDDESAWNNSESSSAAPSRSDSSWKAARASTNRTGENKQDAAPPPRVPDVKYTPQPCVKGMKKAVEVVYVAKGPSEFFCQMKETIGELDNLMARIAEAYEGEGVPQLSNPKVGQACVAKFADDGAWYRGEILSVVGQQQAKVYFIDYGNRQTTSLGDIKVCKEEFAKLPPQSYRCKLTNIKKDFGSEDVFEEAAMGVTSQATFVNMEGNVYLVRLVAEREDSTTSVLNELYGAEPTLNVSVPDRYEKFQLLLDAGKPQRVFVSWYLSPVSFYLSLFDLTTYEEWVKDLDDFYGGLGEEELVETQPAPGRPCAVRFEECQQFYRAQIVSVKDDKAKIIYVDYGNVEIVPLRKIKRITPNFLNYPVQALQCALSGVQYEASQTNEASPLEKALFGHAELQAIIQQEDIDGVFQVDLEAVGKGNVGKLLLEKKIVSAKPSQIKDYEPQPVLELSKGEMLSDSAEVSFIKSALEFWLQPDPATVNELMERIDALAATSDFEKMQLGEVKPGLACLALFAEDRRWYRSRIEDVSGDSIRVSYVDYGNSSEVDASQLKPLLSDLSLFPQCVKCFLAGAEKRPVETEQFEEVAYGNAFTVLFESRDAEANLGVRLVEAEGNDINTQLGLPAPAVTFPVYVSHVESPHCFWLQKVADEDAIYAMQEQLTSALEGNLETVGEVELEKVYAVMHPEFEQWFRGEVTGISDEELVDVRFIDYGDSRKVARSSLKQMPQSVQTAPLAMKCTLPRNLAPANGTWSQEAFDLLSQLAENVVCQAEISGEVDGATLVASLASPDMDLIKELVAKGLAVEVDLSEVADGGEELAPAECERTAPAEEEEAGSADYEVTPHAEEEPTPADYETAVPAEEAGSAENEVTPPAEEEPTQADYEATTPAEEERVPTEEETPVLAKEEAGSVENELSLPAQEEPVPADYKTALPAADEATPPAQEEPAPAEEETPLLTEEEPTPADYEATPLARGEPAPADYETALPTEEKPSPAEEEAPIKAEEPASDYEAVVSAEEPTPADSETALPTEEAAAADSEISTTIEELTPADSETVPPAEGSEPANKEASLPTEEESEPAVHDTALPTSEATTKIDEEESAVHEAKPTVEPQPAVQEEENVSVETVLDVENKDAIETSESQKPEAEETQPVNCTENVDEASVAKEVQDREVSFVLEEAESENPEKAVDDNLAKEAAETSAISDVGATSPGKGSPENKILPGHVVSGIFEDDAVLKNGEGESQHEELD